MANFPQSPGEFEEKPGGVGKMEVSARWTSRNGRLQLTEVTESRSRRKTLEAGMIWASVQDQEGLLDLIKLEEAMKEVYEDFKALRYYKEKGLAGEKLCLHSDQFYYYPDKDILQLTLETLSVQRKELVRGSSRDVGSSRLARCGRRVSLQDGERDLGNKPERIRSLHGAGDVGLSLGRQKNKMPVSGRRTALRDLFCLCGKKKEK
ncbi:uncharacterized protein LOC112541315 [Python bivittatus]|uniref:Uncharacterized protein LOC112541315 n=1 Tax=Python bivittatus TaxID=176946 RepID=A0A9F5MVK1_PYTBI|nr:uncharacterized protein LOC112541315 [Python bivittatus]